MIIKNNFTLGDSRWGSYEPEMETAPTSMGAVADDVKRIIESPYDIALEWLGSSPMSPYTGDLREVRVEITSFYGSIGASHFYVKVYEEDNRLWDWKEKRWISDSRDQFFLRGLALHNGSQFTEDEFTSVKAAIAWAQKIIPIYFPGHKIEEDWEQDYEDW